MRIITWIFFSFKIVGVVCSFGLAVAGNERKETVRPIDYYIRAIFNIIYAVWLYNLMQMVGFI